MMNATRRMNNLNDLNGIQNPICSSAIAYDRIIRAVSRAIIASSSV